MNGRGNSGAQRECMSCIFRSALISPYPTLCYILAWSLMSIRKTFLTL